MLAELTAGEAAKEPQRQSTGDTSEARGSDARRQTTGESVDQEDLVGECSWNRFVTQTSQDHFHPSIEASYIEASNVEASNEEQSGYMILVPQQPWVTPDIGQYQMPFINFTQVGAENPPDDWANTLTVMMRNLPNKFSQQMLLDEINANGFVGAFDFLYLPIDPETRANRGYAFINFVDPYQSWTFKQCYEGRRIGHFNSGKVITVMAATLQGYEANYAHYSSARVCRGDLTSRPLFLRGAPVKQEPVPAQRRRRGRMSLIDAAVKRQQAGGAAGAPGAPTGAAALPGAAFGEGLAPQPQETGQQEEQRTVSFCPFCGGRVKKDFKFCQFCGESLPAA
jgi:hypothetical protein